MYSFRSHFTVLCKQKNAARVQKHTAKNDREIHTAMMKLVAEEIDVAEIYSPPEGSNKS